MSGGGKRRREKCSHSKEELGNGDSPPVEGVQAIRAAVSEQLRPCLFAKDECYSPTKHWGELQHIGDMIHLTASGLLFNPPVSDKGLYDMLEDDSKDNMCAGDEVAGLDLFALVNAVPVEPSEIGNVKAMEEKTENPVSDDGDREGKEIVCETGHELDSRSIIYRVLSREVLQLAGVEERGGSVCGGHGGRGKRGSRRPQSRTKDCRRVESEVVRRKCPPKTVSSKPRF